MQLQIQKDFTDDTTRVRETTSLEIREIRFPFLDSIFLRTSRGRAWGKQGERRMREKVHYHITHHSHIYSRVASARSTTESHPPRRPKAHWLSHMKKNKTEHNSCSSIIVFTIANLIYLIRDSRLEIPPRHILACPHALLSVYLGGAESIEKTRRRLESVCIRGEYVNPTSVEKTRREEKILKFLHGMISDINIVSKKYVRELASRKSRYFMCAFAFSLSLPPFRVSCEMVTWWGGEMGKNKYLN